MSLLELALSRKEVLYSLALVAVVLFSALALTIAPVLYQGWKRTMKRRHAQQAARLARQKRANQRTSQTRRQRERPASAANVDLSAPPVAEAASEVIAAEPEPEAQSEQPVVTETASDVQDILNSVFVDDDVNARYEVLLRGLEVVSAEELVVLANSVAEQLQSGEPGSVAGTGKPL